MGKFNYLFSRNCAFGIKTNSDGSYSIFTRGVDQVTLRIEELIGMALYDGNAFPLKRNANGDVIGPMKAEKVYNRVGGHMDEEFDQGNDNYQNACTIRISRALNYSGRPLPVFFNDAEEQKTEKGADGKNYILNVSSLLAYMLKAYPYNPPLHLENKTKEEYINAIKGKWGIYIMIPKASATNFTASGHADLFGVRYCYSGCYFQYAKEIYFWELDNN